MAVLHVLLYINHLKYINQIIELPIDDSFYELMRVQFGDMCHHFMTKSIRLMRDVAREREGGEYFRQNKEYFRQNMTYNFSAMFCNISNRFFENS